MLINKKQHRNIVKMPIDLAHNAGYLAVRGWKRHGQTIRRAQSALWEEELFDRLIGGCAFTGTITYDELVDQGPL
jgi:hypothetical protein